jgi:hypothetical protein
MLLARTQQNILATIDAQALGLGLFVLLLLSLLLATVYYRRPDRHVLNPRDPRLVTVGFGGSMVRNVLPDPGLVVTCITVRNEPISGRSKPPRDSATDCTARLFDPEAKEYLGGGLQWRNPVSGSLQDRMTLASGEHADLCVFVKAEYSPDYYVFFAQPARNQLPDQLPWVAPDRRQFEVHVTDSTNTTHVFAILVRKSDGNSVGVSFPLSTTARGRTVSAAG